MQKLNNNKVYSYTFMYIFVSIWKGNIYLADKYEIFLVFYKKNLEQQEHKAVLDILSEAIITVEGGGLTYFNR